MRDDDLCALFEGERCVRIEPRLILGEECRIFEFPDIVIKGSGTNQLSLRSYFIGSLGR